MGSAVDGYLAETPYPPHLPAQFAPAWMDHVLRHAGWPPNRVWRGPFRYLDVGCGNGLHLIAFAAAHPEADFVGTDANGSAMTRAAAIASNFGIDNIVFRTETFAETLASDDGLFDYMAALGVLSWVSPANRASVIEIAGRRLNPGGVAAFGYNTLPGRASELLPQRIILEEARRGGDQRQAIGRALDRLAELAATGAHGLKGTRAETMLAKRDQFDPDFLPHEYLSEHWAPLHSADVIRAAEAEGLTFAGSLSPDEIRLDFRLRAAQRELIDKAPDAAERARLIDLCLNQSFRRDLFVKAARPPEDQSKSRLEAWAMARMPADAVAYAVETAAGRLRFDNPAARAIVRDLADGPKPLSAIDAPGTPADRLNALDALLAAAIVEPVDKPAAVRADAFNNWVLERFAAGADVLPAQITPFGARRLNRGELSELARRTSDATFLKRLGLGSV